MNKYIQNLIIQGEHQQLDFKFEISDAKKIAKTISAFANTDGGKLLIGVKDNGVITGIRTDEEQYMVESAAHIFTRPKVDYSAINWNIDGKWVLEVTIEKSELMPHYAKSEDGKWLAYIRVNDQNHLVDALQLQAWKLLKMNKSVFIKYRNNEQQLLNLISKRKKLTLDEFCENLTIKRAIIKNILIKLIVIDVIGVEYSKKGKAMYIDKAVRDISEIISRTPKK